MGLTSRTTVGEVVERSPSALLRLLDYQTGTAGLCVISQDDTIKELSDRFDVPQETIKSDLRNADFQR